MSSRHHVPSSPDCQCRAVHRLAPLAVSALCLLSSPYLIGSATALTAARGRGASSRPFGLASSTTTLLSSSSPSSSIESSYWGTRISTMKSTSRQHASNNKNLLSMDLEVPHPTYTTAQPQRGFLNVVRTSAAAATTIPTPTVRIPSATSPTKADRPSVSSSSPAYFQRFWDTQLDVMHQRLHNLEEIPLSAMSPDQESLGSHKDMSVVENDSSVMITKAFRSNEYTYVRMTLLKGKHSHVFTSVWYPTSPELPILACDLLQFGGTGQQQRHLCIVDYQPVIVPTLATDNVGPADAAATASKIAQHNLDINNKVESVRSQYPGLHGQMSKRFYPEGSPYFSQQMLLGRHVKAPAGSFSSQAATTGAHDDSVPSYDSSDEMVHDVYEAYQLYMDRHVSWAQQHQQQHDDFAGQQQPAREIEQVRIERHSQYDKFSSQYDPALPMLSHMYGSDFADTYVHDVLFPLSRR